MQDGTQSLKNVTVQDNRLGYIHNGFAYAVGVEHAAAISHREHGLRLEAEGNTLTLRMR